MWPPDSSGFQWNDLNRTALTSTTSRWGGSGTRVRPIFIEPTSEAGTIRLGGTGWRGGFFPYPRSLPENLKSIAQPRLSPEDLPGRDRSPSGPAPQTRCFRRNHPSQEAPLRTLSRNDSRGPVALARVFSRNSLVGRSLRAPSSSHLMARAALASSCERVRCAVPVFPTESFELSRRGFRLGLSPCVCGRDASSHPLRPVLQCPRLLWSVRHPRTTAVPHPRSSNVPGST